ncbi:MAG: DUF2280 domain-containing protein [Jiangellaceae bacterium]
MEDPIPNKLNGLKKRKLVRELALGEENQTQLAERYDVTKQAISAFAKRNRDEIEAVRANADDEFAGLLIVQKAHRLGVLEELLERALTPVPKVAPNGRLIEGPDGEILKEFAGDLAAKVIKQAAEEMGQLPNRISLSGNVNVHTSYSVEGVDPTDLD